MGPLDPSQIPSNPIISQQSLGDLTVPYQPNPIFGAPSVIIPQPFTLSNQPIQYLDKIRDEILDKEKTWEGSSSQFFGEYYEFAQSWRVQPKEISTKKPKGLFNSKSGETHRAVETLATLWFRMLTAQDQFFEAVGQGVDPNGQELTPADLYGVEKVLLAQLRGTHFKEKLLRALRSLSLFGTLIFEEPWVTKPSGDGTSYFEATDFQPRSLLQTGFDHTVFDMEMSDYIFTIDYPTIWRLRKWAKDDPETWDKSAIQEQTADESYAPRNSNNGMKKNTNVWNRIVERKQRAGYNVLDRNIRELLSYHGRIETENPVIQAYWESEGRQDDPSDCDFSFGILDGESVVKLHRTLYNTWHSIIKAAHFKTFELEPLGYGVGKIGKKSQRVMDVTESRMDDSLMFGLYSMWKIGRYAGLKPNQLNIKPWNFLELDDINQLEQLKLDMNVVVQALSMQAIRREDFRAASGATSNLQAVATQATATEATLTQTEAIRGGSVHAEIIGETVIRDHLSQMYQNNLDNLDNAIYVSITGEQKPRYYNRHNLPRNIGWELRMVTDKNFTPDRKKSVLEALQLATSIRNLLPQGLNVVVPLFKELFKILDLNPRMLDTPLPIGEQLLNQMRLAQRQQQFQQTPNVQNEQNAEQDGAMAGSGANVSTPMGMVPTSPLPSSSVGQL